jgi:hypothetical protein
MFSYHIESFVDYEGKWKGKMGVMRLFSILVGDDSVSENGNYLQTMEGKIWNWLEGIERDEEDEAERKRWLRGRKWGPKPRRRI